MDAIVGFMGSRDESRLQRMASVLAHRGQWSVDEAVALPFGSLARVALSGSSNVGMSIGPRVVSNGALTAMLCGYVTQFDGSSCDESDLLTRVLQKFCATGIEAIGRIHGAYLFAILDHESGAIHLARDGAGMRTAFFGRAGERWLIASEPKAITTQADFRRTIRPAAIAQYLSFSFTPGTGTMLEDLYEIPCGHAVTLRAGEEPVLSNFFPFETEEPTGRSDSASDDSSTEGDWIQRTRQAVAKAVALRLPRGEPVGVFLSGGLDSSIVAAEVARQHDHKVLSYAIHFGTTYPNELDYARAVADHCGTEHHEILIRPRDFAPRIRQMVWHLDDPIGDPITQPNFELARRVRQDVRWVFNGEGGDPVFGGPKTIPMMLQHWYGVSREHNFREKAYLASYRRAYDECTRVLHENMRAQVTWDRDLESVLTPFFDDTTLQSFLNKLMAINIRLKGAHLILPKVERMLAASELTPLSPLFDEDLIRLSFQMPPKMKLQQGIEKWALKRAYEDALPREVIDRPKSGMRVPVHFWFRGEMRRLANKTLAPRRLRNDGIFDADRVKQLLRYDIEEGSGRYGMRLWMLMTFEIWRRLVVEGESVG
jgi:asparagine synthase (glutamine-hydrolysing)